MEQQARAETLRLPTLSFCLREPGAEIAIWGVHFVKGLVLSLNGTVRT